MQATHNFNATKLWCLENRISNILMCDFTCDYTADHLLGSYKVKKEKLLK